jgi:hypothetical protein
MAVPYGYTYCIALYGADCHANNTRGHNIGAERLCPPTKPVDGLDVVGFVASFDRDAIAPLAPSIGTPAAQDYTNCFPKDLDIQPKGVMLDVV